MEEEGGRERELGSAEAVSDVVEAELETAGLVEGPDGGWGWAIVAASFLTNVIVDGVIFTSGAAFQPQWEDEYGVQRQSRVPCAMCRAGSGA